MVLKSLIGVPSGGAAGLAVDRRAGRQIDADDLAALRGFLSFGDAFGGPFGERVAHLRRRTRSCRPHRRARVLAQHVGVRLDHAVEPLDGRFAIARLRGAVRNAALAADSSTDGSVDGLLTGGQRQLGQRVVADQPVRHGRAMTPDVGRRPRRRATAGG